MDLKEIVIGQRLDDSHYRPSLYKIVASEVMQSLSFPVVLSTSNLPDLKSRVKEPLKGFCGGGDEASLAVEATEYIFRVLQVLRHLCENFH